MTSSNIVLRIWWGVSSVEYLISIRRKFLIIFNIDVAGMRQRWRTFDSKWYEMEMMAKMEIDYVSCSFLFSRFDRMLKRIDKNTLIENINLFRNKNISAHHIINLVKRSEDPSINTDMTKFQMLIYESSILRYILNQIHTYVLSHDANSKSRKLFITENISFNAFFWKSACKLFYVDAETLHAELNDVERVNFVKKFNDFDDFFFIFIIMYQVSAQRINLNRCCFKIIVVISIINVFIEIQTWFRIIRVCFQIDHFHFFSYRYENWFISNINFSN